MDHSSFVFLLGGHDLEMITIKQMLIENGFSEEKSIADHHLQWGAKLSEYQNLFNDVGTFVGVELIPDIDPPPHYINIDHHNENCNKSSSLEQIMDLLKKELGYFIEFTRELQLIAANDKAYIPGMIKMGATSDEIADIRHRDRQAQGVTNEDEKLAEQSIRENLTNENGIKVVKSLTAKFSAITDRLDPCDKLLIYTDNELTYYGEGVSMLILAFDRLIKQKKAYSGGGDKGFFGISPINIPGKEPFKFKIEIISILTHKT